MSCRKNSPADRTEISGRGLTAVEQILNEFARVADLPLDAVVDHVMKDAPITNTAKAAVLGARIQRDYGDLDTLRVVCQSCAPA